MKIDVKNRLKMTLKTDAKNRSKNGVKIITKSWLKIDPK
jgi:hypothetical protein